MQTASYARYAMASHDFRKGTQPWNLAMFGSVAIISAAYVMAGVSKLMTSGVYWVVDSQSDTKGHGQLRAQIH